MQKLFITVVVAAIALGRNAIKRSSLRIQDVIEETLLFISDLVTIRQMVVSIVITSTMLTSLLTPFGSSGLENELINRPTMPIEQPVTNQGDAKISFYCIGGVRENYVEINYSFNCAAVI